MYKTKNAQASSKPLSALILNNTKPRYLLTNGTTVVVNFGYKEHVQGFIEEQPEYSVYLPRSYCVKRLSDYISDEEKASSFSNYDNTRTRR